MIQSCEHCRDLLWDLAYELLEPEQARTVRDHVKRCAACQEALREVEIKQKRIAAAARLAIEVSPFIAPGSEPAVIPFPARPRRRMFAVALAAAALLMAVGLPYGIYEQGVRGRTTALVEAQGRLADAEAERGQFLDGVKTKQEELLQAARGKYVRVQVVGPPVYQVGSASAHHVLVTDLNGKPADADVTARILAADQRELLRTSRRTSQGILVVSLPPNLAADGQLLHLDVVATGPHGRTQLRESLAIQKAEYVTHLAVSKLLYQPGDIVFFRSVTLDRFALTPAKAPLGLLYALTDPANRVIHEAKGTLADGGIGGGAVELPRKGLREGEYILTVSESQGRFPPRSHRIYVHPNRPVKLKKELQFSRPYYGAGDMLEATLRAHRLKDGSPVARKMVTTTLLIDGEPTGVAVRTETDENGTAKLTMRLPEKLGRSPRLTVVINDPGNADALERAIPVEKPGTVIEFFPEGGELLAGVPNRVYFRARTTQGRAATIRGRVVDGRERQVSVVDATGLGLLTFTPEAGQSYRFLAKEADTVFSLPPVRGSGLALSAPAGVLTASQPIPLVVHAVGAPRNVIVAAFCRGRLVAQDFIPALTGRREVRLAPPAGLGGVFRLTAFEDDGELRPAAERLVYRTPAERLNLTADARRAKTAAGEKVTLTFQSAQEDGTFIPAWLLAAVVDLESAGVTASLAGASVPAQFHLLSDLRRPEDLEDADFLLGDGPEAREHLDLFLGTQGWRRFVDPSVTDAGGSPPKEQPGRALFTKFDSYAESWRQCEAELTPALNTLRARTQARNGELLTAQQQSHQAAAAASVALELYQERARSLLRWGITSALVLLGAASVLAILTVGLQGWRESTWFARPTLAGGLAVLALTCATLWGVLQPRVNQQLGGDVAWGPLPKQEFDVSLPPQALVAARTPVRQEGAFAFSQGTMTGLTPSTLAQVEGLVERRSQANGAAGKPIVASTPGKHIAQPASVRRDAVKPEKPLPKPPSVTPSVSLAKEYAHLPKPDEKPATELPDTVLWHPTLFAKDGRAMAEFVLPRAGATYQLLLHGHTSTGRLGFTRLELKTAPVEAP